MVPDRTHVGFYSAHINFAADDGAPGIDPEIAEAVSGIVDFVPSLRNVGFVPYRP